MRQLFVDLRRAWRSLLRQPSFALTAVLILGVGIGANTAVFSVANAVLLRPLPYAQPDRLVALFPQTTIDKMFADELQGVDDVLAASSAHVTATFTLSEGRGTPETLTGARVSALHFSLLRAVPEIGRGFRVGENRPGEDRVAVIGFGLWQRRYGGQETVIGKTILVDDEPRTIVGVLRAEFRPLAPDRQLWIPLRIDAGHEEDYLGSFYLDAIGRLRDDVSAAQATARVRDLVSGLRERYPNLVTDEKVEGAYALPLLQHLHGGSRGVLLLLLAAVGCVLLIACSNVANLMLTRVIRRRREMATRSALGAGRSTLIRMLLVEGLLIGGLGAIVGVALAFWGLETFARFLPSELSLHARIGVDETVLLFALGLAILAAMLFGIWPALRASRPEYQDALRDRSGSASVKGRRTGSAMVVAQIAVATMLMIAAALLAQSLGEIRRVDPGFRAEGLLAFGLTPSGTNYPDGPRQVGFYQRVLKQLEALPGVEGAGAIHLLPLTDGNWRFPYIAEGHPLVAEGDGPVTLPDANFRIVTPGYFETIGTRLVAGRNLTAADDPESTKVAVINRTLAERWWTPETAVGKLVQLFGDGGPELMVVGVVEDVRQHRLEAAPEPELYQAHAQWPNLTMNLLLRTDLHPADLAQSVGQAVWKIDPEVPISDLRPVIEIINETLADQRLVSVVVIVFSFLAFGLGMVGLYAVVAYAVAGRRREFGIRMAFGAQRSSIVARVLSLGIVMTLIGVVLGLALFAATATVLRRYLFTIDALDRGTLMAVALLVALSALASCALPAWRATRDDPATILGAE